MKHLQTFESFEYTELDELNEGIFNKSFKEKFDTKASKMVKYIESKKGDVAKLTSSDGWPYLVMTAMLLGTPYAKYNKARSGYVAIGGSKSAAGGEFAVVKTKEDLQKAFPEYKEVVKVVEATETTKSTDVQVKESSVSTFSDFVNK